MESHKLWDAVHTGHPVRAAEQRSSSEGGDLARSAEAESAAGSEVDEKALVVAALGLPSDAIDSVPEAVIASLRDVLRRSTVLDCENQRLADDVRMRAQLQASLEDDVGNLEAAYSAEKRLVGELQANLDLTSQAKRLEAAQALREVTDLKRQCAQLRGLEGSFQAQLRRLETENSKVKDALTKQRGKRGKQDEGMKMRGAVPPPSGAAAVGAVAIEDKLRLQTAALNREVALLKGVLVDVQQHLEEPLHRGGSDVSGRSGALSGCAHPVNQSVDWFCEDFKANVLGAISKLREKEAPPASGPSPYDSHAVPHRLDNAQDKVTEKELRRKLAAAENMLAEQETLIQSCLFGQRGVPFPSPSKATRPVSGARVHKARTPLSAKAEEEEELQRRWEELERREGRVAKLEEAKLVADELADRTRLQTAMTEQSGLRTSLLKSPNIQVPVSASPKTQRYLRTLGIVTSSRNDEEIGELPRSRV